MNVNSRTIWNSYKGNLTWLPGRTIVLMKHGSHAYGTNTPTSDIDIKGVAIPPKEYLLGFVNKFEQADKGFEGLDCCIYDLRKWFSLATANNPNLIELVYIEPSDLIYANKFWLKIIEHKGLFLSQQAKHAFSGYSISQLKRIQSHRRYLLNPPTHKPTRSEYGLPDHTAIPKEQRDALEAMMVKIIEGWQVDLACVDDTTRIDLINKLAVSLADMKLSADDQYVAAGNKLGLNLQAMEYLKAERAYRASITEWHQYQDWKANRNPIRAEMEAKYGFDGKHGGHLYRLMTMAKEILQGKGVIVKRPDANVILSIRNGAWTYEQLLAWAKEQEQELESLMKTTSLSKQADRAKLDRICIEIIMEWL